MHTYLKYIFFLNFELRSDPELFFAEPDPGKKMLDSHPWSLSTRKGVHICRWKKNKRELYAVHGTLVQMSSLQPMPTSYNGYMVKNMNSIKKDASNFSNLLLNLYFRSHSHYIYQSYSVFLRKVCSSLQTLQPCTRVTILPVISRFHL